MTGKEWYASYLASGEWLRRKLSSLRRAGNRCALCGVYGRWNGVYRNTLHVHHNNYERVGAELDSDLTVLCKRCHEKFHEDAGSDFEILKHFRQKGVEFDV